MNEWLDSAMSQSRFFVEMTVLCMLYSLSLERRNHFYLRFALGLIVGILISILVPINDFFLFLEGLLLAAGMVVLCRRVPLQDGLYCAACAYATQHFYYSAYSLLCTLLNITMSEPGKLSPASLLLSVGVYALFYWLFGRHLTDGGRYCVDVKRSIFSAVMLLMVVLVLSLAVQAAYVPEGRELYMICRAYAMFCCVFFLGMQVSQVKQAQFQEKLDFERQLAQQQREQYEMSRETIDLINRKCHDLKHQVTALRSCVAEDRREQYLSEIDRCVRIYDASLRTGSEVLDTVLTEKSLYCEAHQITLTCIADGAKLSFLDPVDLFTIFGNALDNAIEAACRIADPEKRVAAVMVTARSGLIVYQFENYYEGELRFRGSLPQSTKVKDGGHGFGLRSIQYTVEKYGGFMTIHTENNIFLLRISIPIPD